MFNHINHSIGIYIRAFLITDWRVMKAILLQLHRHSKWNSLWCLMGTYEVCTCTHLFFFTNYHIFILRQNISSWGKKITTEHFLLTVNSQFLLCTFYMLNIASHQRITVLLLNCVKYILNSIILMHNSV